MVDCTEGGAHQDLLSKYNVNGFPTVLFTDPDGKVVDTVGDRSAAAIKAQIERAIAAHKRAGFAAQGLDEAAAQAREAGKLLGVLFIDPASKEGLGPFNEAVFRDPKLAAFKDRFVWVQRPQRDGKKVTDEAKAFKASKAPWLVLVDPRGEGKLEKRILGSAKSPGGLDKLLQKALDKAEKAAAGTPPADEPSEAPEEGDKGE